MRAHFVHALTAAAERPAFGAALFLNALLLSLFVLAWGDGRGIPQYAHATFYAQARVVEMLLLAVLLPWTAVRVAPLERGDDLAMLSAITAVRPSRIAAARMAALFVITGTIVLAAVPVLLIAARMSGIAAVHVVRGQLAGVALAAVATIAGATSGLVIESRIGAWTVASCGTAAVAAAATLWAPSALVAAATGAAVALVLGVGVATRCDSTHRYPGEVAA